MQTDNRKVRHDRVAKARSLRRDVTTPERKLWRHLKRLQIGPSHFRRQAAIGPCFADFACHQKRIAIEIDGETHTSASAQHRDEVRSRYLTSSGYRILRFWNDEVMTNIEGAMEVIHQTVAERDDQTPPPLTPPRASRGRST
ncbi:MAG: endonuclease domain-containing protein [Pseudolabrys sp.]|nr:endonuclease domain-containing protein [Pseudolabrys sp.]MDP2295772.1 endonuclease domain-containing protein [Pseudolabrys sp.]